MTTVYDFSAKLLSGEEIPAEPIHGQGAFDCEHGQQMRVHAAIFGAGKAA